MLKANILQKRSPKGIRGFRWQKRMFRLYTDRIVYSAIETDMPLGEIPLICITKITVRPNNKKTRFNLVMGTFRTFELQAGTDQIVDEWVEILTRILRTFDNNERQKMLKLQRDKFWKLNETASATNTNTPNSPLQDSVKSANNIYDIGGDDSQTKQMQQNGAEKQTQTSNNNSGGKIGNIIRKISHSASNEASAGNNNNNIGSPSQTSVSNASATMHHTGHNNNEQGKFRSMISTVLKSSKSSKKNLNETSQAQTKQISFDSNNGQNNNNSSNQIKKHNDNGSNPIAININNNNRNNGPQVNSFGSNFTPNHKKSVNKMFSKQHTGGGNATQLSSTFDGVSHEIIEPSYTQTQSKMDRKNRRTNQQQHSVDITAYSQGNSNAGGGGTASPQTTLVSHQIQAHSLNSNTTFQMGPAAPKQTLTIENSNYNSTPSFVAMRPNASRQMNGYGPMPINTGNVRNSGPMHGVHSGHVKNRNRNRLSIMENVLPSDINDYKVEEEFVTMPHLSKKNKNKSNRKLNSSSAKSLVADAQEVDEVIPPFGKVAIVSTEVSDAPYLLQVITKKHPDYPLVSLFSLFICF